MTAQQLRRLKQQGLTEQEIGRQLDRSPGHGVTEMEKAGIDTKNACNFTVPFPVSHCSRILCRSYSRKKISHALRVDAV